MEMEWRIQKVIMPYDVQVRTDKSTWS
jgi:hypothetical protein